MDQWSGIPWCWTSANCKKCKFGAWGRVCGLWLLAASEAVSSGRKFCSFPVVANLASWDRHGTWLLYTEYIILSDYKILTFLTDCRGMWRGWLSPKIILTSQDVHGTDSILNSGQTASTFGTTVSHMPEKPYLCSAIPILNHNRVFKTFFLCLSKSRLRNATSLRSRISKGAINVAWDVSHAYISSPQMRQ